MFENGEASELADYILQSIEDREKLRLVCVAILKSLGYHASLRSLDPDAKPKKKSGAQYAKERKARAAAAAEKD